MVPEPDRIVLSELFRKASAELFAVGLTGVSDAGLEYRQVSLIDSLQKSGMLKMHLYVMLAPSKENIENFVVKREI